MEYIIKLLYNFIVKCFIVFIAPEQTVENVSAVVVTNSSDALVTWEPLPADKEIWNFENIAQGAYFAQSGVYGINQGELSHSKVLDGPFVDATFVKTSLNLNVIHTFEISAYSVEFGPYSPRYCLWLPIASK